MRRCEGRWLCGSGGMLLIGARREGAAGMEREGFCYCSSGSGCARHRGRSWVGTAKPLVGAHAPGVCAPFPRRRAHRQRDGGRSVKVRLGPTIARKPRSVCIPARARRIPQNENAPAAGSASAYLWRRGFREVTSKKRRAAAVGRKGRASSAVSVAGIAGAGNAKTREIQARHRSNPRKSQSSVRMREAVCPLGQVAHRCSSL